MTKIIGVDPGLDGAIALLDVKEWTLEVHDMPTYSRTKSKTKRFIDPDLLSNILDKEDATVLYLEAVTASPQMGTVSAFSFGEAKGIVLGVAGALRIPVTQVTPVMWKRRMDTPADKTEALGRARQLFPASGEVFHAKTHADRAEASIIALYGALDQSHSPEKPISVTLGLGR